MRGHSFPLQPGFYTSRFGPSEPTTISQDSSQLRYIGITEYWLLILD